jgi:hypothetical protein
MRDAIDSNGNARPPARRKLTLLVGHDTNISNIGGMLGMHWALPSYLADQTPPAGALHFELLRDRDSGSYAVRVSYIAQTLDQMRHAVQLDRSRPPEQTTATIEGCPTKDGETCAWPTFDALASKAIDHACLGARRKQAEAQARARYSTLMSQGHTDINNGDYDRAIVAFSDDGKLKATPFQANRVLAVIGSMYAFAGRTGVVPEDVNPASRSTAASAS